MREILLTKGYIAFVDDEDYDYLSQFKWYAQLKGHRIYAVRSIKIDGKWTKILMHREIMNAQPGEEVDHIQHDVCCNNCKSNLRLCTSSQNAMNRRVRQGTSSRYKGVCYHKAAKKWRAQIEVDGKNTHLGLFTNEFDAACTYDAAAKKLFCEFALLNFQRGA